MLFVLVFSIAVNVAFFRDIYQNPTLGIWSNLVLAYVGLTVIFGFFLFIRLYLPLPFIDNSVNLSIEALKGVDERLYRRKVNEVYGPDSKYRKYTVSHHVHVAATMILARPRRLKNFIRSFTFSKIRRRN